MALILKNPGTQEIIIEDFLQTKVLAGDSIDISGYPKWQFQTSIDLVTLLINGSLILNDGLTDIPVTEAISLVRGIMPSRLTTEDGKLYTVQSARPLNQYYYVTGMGDDLTTMTIGAGVPLTYSVAPGQTQIIDAAFTEDVMFMGGTCSYDNARAGSYVSGEIIAPPGHPYIALDRNGNYDLDSQRRFVPNDTNTGTHFINLMEEVSFFRFINKAPLFGSDRCIKILGSEPTRLFRDYMVRISLHNASTDTTMTAQVYLEMYRRHTM